MKHLKGYFDNFEADKLNPLFDQLHQDGWTVSEENLVDSFGTRWNFRDIDHFVYFSKQVFSVIVAGYKIFLELLEDKSSENIQEKLESANSKIKLLEEQNDNLLKRNFDLRKKELYIPVESSKPSTKEYISLRRRKYVKIE